MFARKLGRVRPALALVTVLLGGCSSADMGTSWYSFGRKVEIPQLPPNSFPDHYKQEIADFMRTYLNNPTKVKDAFVGQPVLRPVMGKEQYVTCVRYNPRDTKERYEGQTTRLAIFLSGRVVQFLADDPAICAGLTYQRFPEIEAMVP